MQAHTHIVALSGGKDSTALALRLKEINPGTAYQYVITPTGDELPDMVEHWLNLAALLETRLTPITNGRSLSGLIREQKALPNHRMRWCTRMLKIEPFMQYAMAHAPATVLVGLRYDEETRGGAVYGDIDGITQRFPLREWRWGLKEVLGYLSEKGVRIPDRTDCARCYAQTVGEWWNLWRFHPQTFDDAARQEEAVSRHRGASYTFRSDQRDSWPASLKEMRAEFELGKVPTRSKTVKYQGSLFEEVGFERGKCRVCTL